MIAAPLRWRFEYRGRKDAVVSLLPAGGMMRSAKSHSCSPEVPPFSAPEVFIPYQAQPAPFSHQNLPHDFHLMT